MLNELAREIHDNAVAHGWWDGERSFGDIVALCHSELSEALEEHRNHMPNVYCVDKTDYTNVSCLIEGAKPEGIAVEMIDCIIRILDWCGKEGVDVDAILTAKHQYNKTRQYRHGGKAL